MGQPEGSGEAQWFPRPSPRHARPVPAGGVSVVVCSRDRATLLAAALAAIEAVLRPDDELIVVDSASTDAAVAVTAVEAGARVSRTAAPGLGRARNAGWPLARRPIVAFTDDDCRPQPGWTAALASAFDDPRVGFVYGRVRAGEGGGQPLSVLDSEQGWTIDTEDPDALGHGANLACRREALVAVDGFDDELGAGARFPAGEDTDIALRMVHAGWIGRYTPTAEVSHALWRGRQDALRVYYAYGRGAAAVAYKQAARGQRHALRTELMDRGVRQTWRDLRSGYQYGVLAGIARTAGVCSAAIDAARMTVQDGKYVR